MSTDEVVQGARKLTDAMATNNPFLGIMLIAGIVLVGWYVYQQQNLNEKLISIQVEAAIGNRDKIEAIDHLVKANNRAAAISEMTATNLQRLVEAVHQTQIANSASSTKVLHQLQTTVNSASEVAASMDQLRFHIMARDHNKQSSEATE